MKSYALFCGILTCIILSVPAQAVDPIWLPSKPIEIWVASGKGTYPDVWAKDIVSIIEQQRLSPVPFKVVNVPKGNGKEALPIFGSLKNEDHKLMFVLSDVLALPLFQPNIANTLNHVTPIARIGSEALAIWVKSQESTMSTIGQLTRTARQKGRAFTMAGPPQGTSRAMLARMFMALHAIDGTYVGIKRIGSTARALAEKDFDAAIYAPSEQLKLSNPDLVKPVAFFTDKRAKNFSHVPTLSEKGVPLIYEASRIIIGPPDMKRSVQEYYVKLLQIVCNTPEWQKIRGNGDHLDGFLAGQDLQNFIVQVRNKHSRWKMALEVLMQAN